MSCKEDSVNPDKVLWGKTNYYKDFLFKKYKSEMMTHTLEFEFNDDAKRLIDKEILLELVEKDKGGKLIPCNGINLYKNGVECPNNTLSINIKEDTADISIEFTKKASEGNHTLYLCVKNSGGLDRIDNVDLYTENDAVLTHEWVVKKDDVYNPLAFGLFCALIIIVALLILWRILIRPMMYETFKVRKLYVFYPDAPMKTVNLKGIHKVVCTKENKQQSFLGGFFLGKIIYVQNGFWEQNAEISPRNKNSVRIRIPNSSLVVPSSIIEKGADLEILSIEKSIKLQIQ